MNGKKLLVPLVLLALWSGLSYPRLVSEFFMATPTETLRSLYDLTVSGAILQDLAFTLGRILIGLVVGSAIGMIAGLLLGLVPAAWDYCEPTVDFFRSLPAFALFPFFILIFGPGDTAKVATVTWFIAFIMLISSAYAIRDTNVTRINAAHSLGANRFQTFLYVVLPQGVPQLMVGFRTSLSFAPIVVIATEMFSGTRYGLGDRIYEARLVYRVPEMYAALVVAGLLGFGINSLFVAFCRRRVHWTGK